MQVLICLVAEEFKQMLYLTINSSLVKIVSLTDGLSAFECQRFHILTMSQHSPCLLHKADRILYWLYLFDFLSFCLKLVR